MRFNFTIHCKQDLIETVQTFGIVPLFANSIPGFSVEEHCDPRCWFSDTEEGVWEWKGPVIRESGCAYGKFFEKKAAFVSRECFLDLANYRRDGYDFDARYDEGLASRQDKELFNLIDAHAPILSKELKAIGNYRKGGRKGFETSINRLQEQGYVIISDFVYQQDRFGKTYGWGVAEYSTPEKLFGQAFSEEVYRREPEESRKRIFDQMQILHSDADVSTLMRFMR
jgi:hypothetical protein